MASACVNNIRDCPPSFSSSFNWLTPHVSLDSKTCTVKSPEFESPAKDSTGDFEFRLHDDPVTMLPADQLFSDGKLVPLQLSSLKPTHAPASPVTGSPDKKPETLNNEPYLFSPKAPRCSSRWRELLGLKKNKQENYVKTTSSSSYKSIRNFLTKNPKTTSSTSASNSEALTLPLLKDTSDCCTTCDSISVSSSRLSLSSTSSSSHDDLPRLSLDFNPPRVRMRPTRMGRGPVRRAHQDPSTLTRGVSVDSPRMNSSGKVVFQSLERSSSSPSSLNGGRPRYCHHLGIERSYSANVVRITPVLNVPVCSLRGSSKNGVFGFGQLFSPQKKDSHTQHSQRQNSGKIKRDAS